MRDKTSEEFNTILQDVWDQSWMVGGEPLTGEQVVFGYHYLASIEKYLGSPERANKARSILKKAGLIRWGGRWVRTRDEISKANVVDAANARADQIHSPHHAATWREWGQRVAGTRLTPAQIRCLHRLASKVNTVVGDDVDRRTARVLVNIGLAFSYCPDEFSTRPLIFLAANVDPEGT